MQVARSCSYSLYLVLALGKSTCLKSLFPAETSTLLIVVVVVVVVLVLSSTELSERFFSRKSVFFRDIQYYTSAEQMQSGQRAGFALIRTYLGGA